MLSGCGVAGVGQEASVVSVAVPAATTMTNLRQPGDFNEADVMFVQMMILHHRQATEMAELAGTRASDEEVKKLAAEIKATQQPEVTKMQNWLTKWGKPTPADGMARQMPGSMSEQDMEKLGEAKGAAFDKEFLQMMTTHHKGAIAMARTEQQQGANPGAKQLANKIETEQQAQVQQMQKIR